MKSLIAVIALGVTILAGFEVKDRYEIYKAKANQDAGRRIWECMKESPYPIGSTEDNEFNMNCYDK